MPKTKSLLLFLYQLRKTAELRSFSMHCKCKNRPTFGGLSNQGLCHLGLTANTTENFSEINLERKNQTFWFMEKHLSYNFHLWENVYHRDFIHFSVRMALYGIV